MPKARQITRLLLTRPDHLKPGEREQLAAIRAACPHIDALAGHITAFAEMMDGLTGAAHLDPWLAAAEAADGPLELRSFATGIRNDKEAVLNGLTLPCNSARVEGIVNKVKAVKRQMYGRASFTLLQARHPAPSVTSTTKFAEEPEKVSAGGQKSPDIWLLRQYVPRGPYNRGRQRHEILDEDFLEIADAAKAAAPPLLVFISTAST